MVHRIASPTMSAEEPFPLNLRTDLVKLLEPDDRLHNNNWKQVANRLRLPYREILYLDSQRGTRYGPMDHLLQMWEQENRTLGEFKDLMKEIRRVDVVNRIEHYERLFNTEQPKPPHHLARKVHQTIKRIGPRSSRNQNDLNRVTIARDRLNSQPLNGMKPTVQWHPVLRQISSVE